MEIYEYSAVLRFLYNSYISIGMNLGYMNSLTYLKFYEIDDVIYWLFFIEEESLMRNTDEFI